MSRRMLTCVLTASLLAGVAPLAGAAPSEERGRVPGSSADAVAAKVAAMERDVLDRTNGIRRDRGLRALGADPTLSRLAREHSCDMAREDLLSHTTPAGGDLLARLRAAGTPFEMVGENVAQTSGVDRPVATVIQGWMDSPGHRRNILQPDFTHTGAGACRGDGGYFFTQIFTRARGA
jgi:uncharacterized protein YkwD